MHACRTLAAFLVAGAVLAGLVLAQQNPANPAPRTAAGEYQLSGPYSHDNLAIFLIHGPDRLKGRKFVMLADALDKKKFVIYETQKVNDLTMENLSPNEEVLILSGDILKGGQQDRIAKYDQLVPPKSGKLPLTVFCVEHTAGRWMRPMTEADKTFTACPGQLCTNDLRLANRFSGSQSGVWMDVTKTQDKLTRNAGTEVKVKESDSSLALSLQVKEVRAAADKYVAKFLPIVREKPDVVGFAFAVNGKVYTADVYGSPVLFAKVWPRLLQASAIEAFADLPKDKKFPTVSAAAVKTFLEEADKGKATNQDVTKEIRQQTNSAERVLRFETIDQKGASLRRNYLKK